MKHQISVTFTAQVLSILDVNLNAIAQLMKQQGFELSGLNACPSTPVGLNAYPSITTQVPLPLPLPLPDPAPEQEKVRATPPTRARRTRGGEPETTPPAEQGAADPAPASTEPPPPRDKNEPRSPEGQGFEAQLRALLTPLAAAGRGEEVSQFVQGRGYKTLSAIPDSVIGAALAAAQQHFGNVQ